MGLALGRSFKVLCGPQIRTPAAPLAFPSRPMPPDELSFPWTAAQQLSCCCILRTSVDAIHMFLLFPCGAWSVNLLRFALAVAALSLNFAMVANSQKNPIILLFFIN